MPQNVANMPRICLRAISGPTAIYAPAISQQSAIDDFTGMPHNAIGSNARNRQSAVNGLARLA